MFPGSLLIHYRMLWCGCFVFRFHHKLLSECIRIFHFRGYRTGRLQ